KSMITCSIRSDGIGSIASSGTLILTSVGVVEPASVRECEKSTITSVLLVPTPVKPTLSMKSTVASDDATCASTAACSGPPIITLKSMLLSSDTRLFGAGVGGVIGGSKESARTARPTTRPAAACWLATSAAEGRAADSAPALVDSAPAAERVRGTDFLVAMAASRIASGEG